MLIRVLLAFSSKAVIMVRPFRFIFNELTYMVCTENKISSHYKNTYQSPLILTDLFQHNLINVSYLTACYLYQVMMTLHFLNDVGNDAEPTQKWRITS